MGDMQKVVIGVDCGFSSVKGVGAIVTQTPKELRLSALAQTRFRSICAPRDGVSQDTMLLGQVTPYSALMGEDAALVKPFEWYAIPDESLYPSGFCQYVLQAIGELLFTLQADELVEVHLTVSLPRLHQQYFASVQTELAKHGATFALQTTRGTWQVTLANVEYKLQPYLILLDHFVRPRKNGVVSVQAPMAGVQTWALDCGSKTFSGEPVAGTLHQLTGFSESGGAWNIIASTLPDLLRAKATEAGMSPEISELRCVQTYETGVLRHGQLSVDVCADIQIALAPFINSRLETLRRHWRQQRIGDVLLHGGDVQRQADAIKAEFAQRIEGTLQLTTDDAGQKETMFRIAEGAMKWSAQKLYQTMRAENKDALWRMESAGGK